MRIRKHHQRATPPLAPTSRRRRRLILLGAGTLALLLSTTGMVTVLAGWSSHTPQHPESSVAVAGASRDATAPPTAARPSPNGHASPPPPTKSPGPPTAPPTPAPVLADGTYPTYLGEVDVDGATITVDVVQLFEARPPLRRPSRTAPPEAKPGTSISTSATRIPGCSRSRWPRM
jgi:hypothetical protein